jgi:agmatine/peptidylarginine deiminase
LDAQQRPTYPEGATVPRSMTPLEEAWVAQNPLGQARAVSAPPTGPVHCVAEYEPMAGIFLSWEGSSSWTTILSKMAAEITTIGNADVYCMVDSNSEATSASTKIASYGANMARVHFPVETTDTIWIRDYGPRYIYQGDVRAIVDHTYNRPRPNDDLIPSFLSGYLGHTFYEHSLIHGGGNFHLDAVGGGYLTELINNENPGLSDEDIKQVFRDYQNLETELFTPLPVNVDSTQHIDMWMQVYGDDKVMISDWPAQSGSAQDVICDQAAIDMAALGFTVTRTPARKVGFTHYTYTNVVMCNDLVLIPSYTNSSVVQYNATSLADWQAALPGKTIVQIDAQAIVTSAGVLHCIVMHLPAHLGGTDPTAYLVTPDGGEILDIGDQVEVTWISDDDVAATSAELELSTDGGQTWTTEASGLPAAGSTSWTVPASASDAALLRVVVADAGGATGTDASGMPFAIAAPNDAAAIAFGNGKEGTLGVPRLSIDTAPALGAFIQLNLEDGLPNGTAKLLRGSTKATTPFDQAEILVQQDTVLDLAIDPNGDASLNATVPNNPALIGRSFYWQCWIPNDPAASGLGWACSQGLETRLGN